jgi:membrane-associated phospholipid phosphatase
VSSLHPIQLRPRLGLGALAGFLVAVPLTLLAFAVRVGWDPVRDVDRGVADGLHREVAREPGAVAALNAIAVGFDPWVFRAAVVLLVVVLLVRGAHRLAWWAAITMTAGSVLGFVLKLVMARARPSFEDPAATAPGFSFPSGHALNSAVAVLVFLLVLLPALPGVRTRVAAWVTGATIVFVTGFDRVALGVHYVSDVLAGWLVAVALVAATAAAFETWRRDVGRPPHDPIEGVDPEEAGRLR